MIHQTEVLLNDFSKHFNSRFNLSTFISAFPLFVDVLNKKVDKTRINMLQLPCEPLIYKQLIDFGYKDLLNEIIKRVTIEEEASDVYFTKFDPETFKLYKNILSEEIMATKVRLNPEKSYFEIICPELTQELLWSPVSQFHAEVTLQLEYFNNRIDLYGESSDRSEVLKSLYINSKVPTSYSYFVIAYLAENLGIPLTL